MPAGVPGLARFIAGFACGRSASSRHRETGGNAGGVAGGEFTNVGTLQGHTYLGTRRVERAIEAIKDFPGALSNALLHMLLSHHGTSAYGAPTSPAFGEAVVLSQCDLISARAFACRLAKRDAIAGQSVVWRSLGDSSRIFVGPLGIGDESAGDDTPASVWDEEELVLPEIHLPPASKKRGQVQPQNNFVLSDGFGANLKRIPVVGNAAAGDAERSTEGWGDEEIVVVAPPGGVDFSVRVKGDSMIGVGIFDQDLLLVRRQETPRNRDIVVAHIPGQGQVVKRYLDASDSAVGQPVLHSENDAYPPILISEGTLIQGKVVGLHRLF